MLKRILLIVLCIFLLAQLAQPDRSAPAVVPSQDMLAVTGAPADIKQMIIGACYDCHSYQTQYPVWAYITPMNFWIQSHINEARGTVNFSRWDLYAGNEEAGESGESIAEGEMPPSNYAAMHGHAELTDAQKLQLIAWFDANTGGVGREGGTGRNHGED
ncbi:MAG: heme-binding domain-containing protein [Flavobacteriales bacterium]